jgi:predicted TIM-barrel fold metal-dependent hydrolase
VRGATRGVATLLPDPEPGPVWCPIISVDDHVLEPADLFEQRVPARFRDVVPRVEYDDDRVPFWVIDGVRHPIIVANGAVGRPAREKTFAPQKYEEFRTGVWDARARLADFDLIGVWASLSFPSLLFGFAGYRLAVAGDEDAGLAAVRAYNDWMLGEWCGTDVDRFIPCQVPCLSDPEVAAAEVRANAARGFKAVSFTENPEGQGLPGIYTSHWDPFFAACEETDTVLCLHVGSSGSIRRPSSVSPAEVMTGLFPIAAIEAVLDWIFARIPLRFPGLRIALSEGGVSWVPMVIERLRRVHRLVEQSTVWSIDDPDPVDVLRRNFWFTSIEDPSAFRNLDLIGEDRVMVESDYPHTDSSWPDTQHDLRVQLEHLREPTIRKLCYGNAADLYRHAAPPASFLADRRTL